MYFAFWDKKIFSWCLCKLTGIKAVIVYIYATALSIKDAYRANVVYVPKKDVHFDDYVEIRD